MKRLRLEKWSGQLLSARPGATITSLPSSHHHRAVFSRRPEQQVSIRRQSSAAAPNLVFEDGIGNISSHYAPPSSSDVPSDQIHTERMPLPSPPPERALSSAKLAALHARLSLSPRVPLQTLARTLVDPSADECPLFNNVNLAYLGQTLINYHSSELLICRYPRLPMEIMYAALKAYAGSKTLHDVAKSWGVESAADPGEEVDPGLLQFSLDGRRSMLKKWGVVRPEAQYILKYKWRRGISSRVIMDDDFGDAHEIDSDEEAPPTDWDAKPLPTERKLTMGDPEQKLNTALDVHATFVRAVVGAIFTHCGREAAKNFIKAHVLSRHLDLAKLFSFKRPTRELSRLCAREEFEAPVARLLSETGRLSRTPVFVVGIYSGNDMLGEGAAANLDHARTKAAMNALMAWYLYSPGDNVRVPSDMMVEKAKPWDPVYVDMGEII